MKKIINYYFLCVLLWIASIFTLLNDFILENNQDIIYIIILSNFI